jgi:hypothetical protein
MQGEVRFLCAHTRTLLLALHLAGPLGRPRPQILLLRTSSTAEPGCRLSRSHRGQQENERGRLLEMRSQVSRARSRRRGGGESKRLERVLTFRASQSGDDDCLWKTDLEESRGLGGTRGCCYEMRRGRLLQGPTLEHHVYQSINMGLQDAETMVIARRWSDQHCWANCTSDGAFLYEEFSSHAVCSLFHRFCGRQRFRFRSSSLRGHFGHLLGRLQGHSGAFEQPARASASASHLA